MFVQVAFAASQSPCLRTIIETISVAQTGALINADRPPSAKTLRGWETELAFPKPRVIAYDKAKFLAWISRRAKA